MLETWDVEVNGEHVVAVSAATADEAMDQVRLAWPQLMPDEQIDTIRVLDEES